MTLLGKQGASFIETVVFNCSEGTVQIQSLRLYTMAGGTGTLVMCRESNESPVSASAVSALTDAHAYLCRDPRFRNRAPAPADEPYRPCPP